MTLFTTSARYGAIAQTFHWLTVIFVGAAYIISAGGPESRVYSDQRAYGLTWHETLGTIVLALVVLRLLWRLVDRAPEEPPMPGWMLIAARGTHWLLYALLAAVPLTAIVGAWLEGHPITLFGFGAIGPWLTLSHDLGHTITELHGDLGNIILWVAGLHAAAALYHHFVLRDRVLVAMLPGGSPPPRP